MNIPDYYNLLDYSKTFYKSNRDGKPYCRVGVSLNDGELTVWRFDFEEWEYNRRTGVVESSYSLDLVNTRQFCSSLKTYSSVAVVKEMKKRFGNHSVIMSSLIISSNFATKTKSSITTMSGADRFSSFPCHY